MAQARSSMTPRRPGTRRCRGAGGVGVQLAGSRFFLALPISLAEVEAQFANGIVREDVLTWDASLLAVVARRRRRLGALVLDYAPLADPDPEAVARMLVEGISR